MQFLPKLWPCLGMYFGKSVLSHVRFLMIETGSVSEMLTWLSAWEVYSKQRKMNASTSTYVILNHSDPLMISLKTPV